MGSVLEADLRLSLNKELDVLSVSDRVQGLLGYSSQDFLNARVSIEKLLHLNDAAKLRHIFDATIPKLSGELNVRFRHADGQIRSMRLRYEREDRKPARPWCGSGCQIRHRRNRDGLSTEHPSICTP